MAKKKKATKSLPTVEEYERKRNGYITVEESNEKRAKGLYNYNTYMDQHPEKRQQYRKYLHTLDDRKQEQARRKQEKERRENFGKIGSLIGNIKHEEETKAASRNTDIWRNNAVSNQNRTGNTFQTYQEKMQVDTHGGLSGKGYYDYLRTHPTQEMKNTDLWRRFDTDTKYAGAEGVGYAAKMMRDTHPEQQTQTKSGPAYYPGMPQLKKSSTAAERTGANMGAFLSGLKKKKEEQTNWQEQTAHAQNSDNPWDQYAAVYEAKARGGKAEQGTAEEWEQAAQASEALAGNPNLAYGAKMAGMSPEEFVRQLQETNRQEQVNQQQSNRAASLVNGTTDLGHWLGGTTEQVQEAMRAGNAPATRAEIDRLRDQGYWDEGNDLSLMSEQGLANQRAKYEQTSGVLQGKIDELTAQAEGMTPLNTDRERQARLLEAYITPEIENELTIINGEGYTEEEKKNARIRLQELRSQAAYGAGQFLNSGFLSMVNDKSRLPVVRRELYDAMYGRGAYKQATAGMTEEERATLDGRLDDAYYAVSDPYGVVGRDLRTAKAQLEYAQDQIAEIDRLTAQDEKYAELMAGADEIGNVQIDPATVGTQRNPTLQNQYTPAHPVEYVAAILSGDYNEDVWINDLQYGQALLMSDEEKNKFADLYNNGKKNEAWAFYQGLEPMLNQYYHYFEDLAIRQTARRIPITSSIATEGMHLAQPVEALINLPEQLASAVFDTGSGVTDPYSSRYLVTRMKNGIRAQVAQDVGDWDWVYNGFMSGVDSALNVAIGKGLGLDGKFLNIGGMKIPAMQAATLGLFHTQAFETSLQNSLTQGNDQFGYDFIEAWIDAAIETATEIWSVENWMADPTNILRYVGKIAISEPSEEIVGAIIEPYVKEMLGHKNEYKERAKQILANGGYTDGDGNWVKVNDMDAATRQAMREWNHDIRMAAQEALLSVGPSIVYGSARIATDTNRTGRAIQSNNVNGEQNATQELAEAAARLNPETESYKQAQKMLKRLENGKKISNYDAGKLATSIIRETNEQIGNTARQVLEDRVAEDLQGRGMQAEEAREYAGVITEAIEAEGIENLNRRQRNMVNNNPVAKAIYADYMTEEKQRETGRAQREATMKERASRFTVEALMLDRKTNDNLDVGEQMSTEQERKEAQGKVVQGTMGIVYNQQNAKLGSMVLDADGKPKYQVYIEGQQEPVLADSTEIRANHMGTAAIIQSQATNPEFYSQGYTNVLLQAMNDKRMENKPGILMRDAMLLRYAAYEQMGMAQTELPADIARNLYEYSQAEYIARRAADTQNAKRSKLKPGQGYATYKGYRSGSAEFDKALKQSGLSKADQQYVRTIADLAKAMGAELTLTDNEEIVNSQNGELAQFKDDPSKLYGSEKASRITVNLGGMNFARNLETGKIEATGEHHNVVVTFGHEAVHFLQENTREGFDNLAQYVLNEQRNKLGTQGLNDRLDKIMHDQGVDLYGAISELVADSCDNIFSSQEVIDHIQQTNKGLYQNLKNFAKNMITRLRNAIKGSMSADSRRLGNQVGSRLAKLFNLAWDEAASRELVYDEKAYQKAIDMIQDAMEHPVDNFRMSQVVEMRDDGLMAVHNLHMNNLMKLIRMGGIAMPSVGVINSSDYWTNFGDVSLFLDKSFVDMAIRQGRAFAGDAFTAVMTNDVNTAEEALQQLRNQPERRLAPQNLMMAFLDYQKVRNIDQMRNRTSMKLTDEQRRTVLRELNEKQRAVEDEIKDMLITGLINEQGMTADEAETYMAEHNDAINAAIGRAALLAVENIEQQQENGKNVWEIDTYGIIAEELNNAFEQMGLNTESFGFIDNDAIEEAILDYANYAEENLPADMMEIKPDTIVTFDQVSAILLPQNVDKSIVQALVDAGMNPDAMYFYDGRQDRIETMKNIPQQVEGVRFSRAQTEKNTEDVDGYPDAIDTGKTGNRNTSVIDIIADTVEEVNDDAAYQAAVERGDLETATRMLMEKLKSVDGVIPFMAPEWHAGESQKIAENMKHNDPEAIRKAAEAMAKLVPDNAVLIPMPGRKGIVEEGSWIMNLTNRIAELTGRPVVVALEGQQRESRQEAKHDNRKGVSQEELGFRVVEEIPEGTLPIFIDNTIGTGITADAARIAMGGGMTLAYTKTLRSPGIIGLKNVLVTYESKKNGGALIPLSKRFDVSKRDVRYSQAQLDDDYMAAVKSGDVQRQQELVDRAAQKAGYVKAAYHGTLNGGFTIFDKNFAKIGGNSGAGFYFSSNLADSEANYQNVEGADNWFKANDLAEKIQNELDNSGEDTIEYEGHTVSRDMPFIDIVNIAKQIMAKNPTVYNVYLDQGRAYIRNFEKSTNLIEDAINNFDESLYDREDYENEDDWYDELSTGRMDEIYQAISDAVYNGIADVDSNYEIYSNINYENIIGNLAQIAMDYDQLTWNDLIKVLNEEYIEIGTHDMEDSTDGSHEIARAIVEAFGFDSIEDREASTKFNQLKKMGKAGETIHYIMFRPNQIKLSDPITYDNDGNVIPPSERFNAKNNDIRWSRAITDERQNELSQAWQDARDEANDLREQLRALKPEMDAWVDRLTEAQKNGTMDEALEEYKEWEKGYTKVSEALSEAERRYKEANKAYDDYIEQRDVAAEQKKISESGLSEAEYRRKQAVDEFGYTTDFREAGYLLPNGRMLNFTGEKGKHYGTRGEDHRGIGRIYASSQYQGGAAMMAFMKDGNIRVMAETPGVDIVSTKEPTTEQYAAIRNMARRFAGEEYFNVDFTDEKGYNADSIEYDGRVNPDRIVNDIKTFFRTGVAPQQSVVDQFHFSRWTEEGLDVNNWMMSATPSTFQTEDERELWQSYKDLRIKMSLSLHRINEYQAKIRQLESKAQLTAEERDELTANRNRLEIQQKKLADLEDELYQVTSSEGYAGMMYRQNMVLKDYIEGKTQDQVRQTVEGMLKEVQRAQEEIRKDRADLLKLAETQAVKTVQSYMSKSSLGKMASLLRNSYNSSMTKGEIQSRLAEMALKQAQGEDITSDAEQLAQDLLDKMRGIRTDELQYLKGTTLRISEDLAKEMRSENLTMADLRNQLKGSGVTIKTEKGANIRQQWAELYDRNQSLPNIDEDYSESDALHHILDFIQGQVEASRGINQNDVNFDEVAAVVKIAAGNITTYLVDDPAARKQIENLMGQVKELAGKTGAIAEKMDALDRKMDEVVLAGQKAKGWTTILQRDVSDAIKYYNKTAKVAAQVEKTKVRKALIEQLRSENTKKLLAQQDAFRERLKNDKKARELAQDNGILRSKISTVATRMANRIFAETDQKNVPEEAKAMVRQVLYMISQHDGFFRKVTYWDKQQVENIQLRLAKMIKYYGQFNPDTDLDWLVVKAANEEDNDYTAQEKVIQDLIDIETGLMEYRNAEGRGRVTLQDRKDALIKVQKALSEIWDVVQARSEMEIAGRKWQVIEMAEWMRDEMKKSRFKGERRGFGSRARNALTDGVTWGNLTPEYFFKNLKNAAMSMLHTGLKDAENRSGLEAAKAKQRLAEIAEKNGFASWDGQEEHKVKTRSGEITMTTEQIMALYATWLRESNALRPEETAHLLHGGFVLAEKENNKGLPGREKKNVRPIRMSPEHLDALGNYLTEAQKQYVNDMVAYMSGELAELGNEASMKMYGIKKFTEKYYFPIKSWGGVLNKRSDAGISSSNENRAAQQGFSKRIKNNASNAIEIGDFTPTAIKHVAGMITYNTVGPAIENMNKVLNQQLKYGEIKYTDEGDVSEDDTYKVNMRAAFANEYGKQAGDYLAKFMKDMNGGVTTERTAFDKLLSMFKKNAVAGSLSVAAQQPLSYIRAAMMINPKYLAAAISPQYWKGSYAEMMKHSGVAVIKKMGKFDMNFGQTMQEWIAPEGMESKARRAWNKTTDLITGLPGAMDAMTWTRMWTAVKLEQAALNKGMDTKSDEFLEKVAERFNDLMRQTQVYDSVMTKSQNMRSQHWYAKTLTSFMAEPTLSLNVLADAFQNLKEKGGKMKAIKAVATFLMSAAAQAGAKAFFGTGRTPDKKKNKEENFMNKFGYNLLSEVNPLGLIPGYRQIIETLTDGEFQDDTMGMIAKAGDVLENIFRLATGKIGDKGLYRDLEDSIGQFLQLTTDIPAKNLMRDFRAMVNFFTNGGAWEFTGDGYAQRATSNAVLKYQLLDTLMSEDLIGLINGKLGEAGYGTSNKDYYARIFNAERSGNTAAAEEMKEYLLTGKGVSEKTLNENIRPMYKNDDDLSSAEKLERQKEYGLKQTTSFITDEYAAGNLSREEAEKLYRQENPKATDKDVMKMFDKIDWEKAGNDSDGFTNYTPLMAAIENNKAEEIRKAVDHMTQNGYTAKDIQKEVNSRLKKEYLAAESEKEKLRIRDALTKTYKALGRNGSRKRRRINRTAEAVPLKQSEQPQAPAR